MTQRIRVSPKRRAPDWTSEEDARLTELFMLTETSRTEIARKIGRTRAACDTRITKLGLKRPPAMTADKVSAIETAAKASPTPS